MSEANDRHRYQQFFFNGQPINVPVNEPMPINLDLDFNNKVFEISNNWDDIKQVLTKYKNQTLKTVDQLQHDCLDFIIKNNINLDAYENENDFIKLVLRPLGEKNDK